MIPTEILFGYQKEQARLSADGQFLAFLAPSPDGVSNVVSTSSSRSVNGWFVSLLQGDGVYIF
jgi:hypothetical protein